MQPHHSNLVSQTWFPGYQQNLSEEFVSNNITRFRSTAIFDAKEPQSPCAWTLFKAGGMIGMRYTIPSLRRQNFSNALRSMELWKMILFCNAGYGEIEDDMINLWKIKHDQIIARSVCIWNFPSLQKTSNNMLIMQ